MNHMMMNEICSDKDIYRYCNENFSSIVKQAIDWVKEDDDDAIPKT